MATNYFSSIVISREKIRGMTDTKFPPAMVPNLRCVGTLFRILFPLSKMDSGLILFAIQKKFIWHALCLYVHVRLFKCKWTPHQNSFCLSHIPINHYIRGVRIFFSIFFLHITSLTKHGCSVVFCLIMKTVIMCHPFFSYWELLPSSSHARQQYEARSLPKNYYLQQNNFLCENKCGTYAP